MTAARRGFAALTPEERAELGARGGRSAHARGTAHEWKHDDAQDAGRLGGQEAQRRRKARHEHHDAKEHDT